MVNYAFPELHPESKHPPSKNLLIYTQSSVDSSGRRHSVSIPLLPSSTAKPDTTVLSIQRKGSGERGKVKNMESIEETSVKVSSDIFTEDTADNNVAMDCLTVPGMTCSTGQQMKMSARKNSLPARRGSNSSQRGSPRRSSKQEFYQFLDMAIAH
eukprot:GFUD01118900.1.p1 GENE.GFUD01118900.1~~GFUD01118900.1.p1  ORF type:complete len:155 (+),score=49.14 GFUD01118900.1:109-573(+)